MRVYYVEHPRDFANEYTVYAVDAKERKTLELLIPNARRIARQEAFRLGWSRPIEAKRDGEFWLGGFHEDTLSMPPESLEDALAECVEATGRKLEELGRVTSDMVG